MLQRTSFYKAKDREDSVNDSATMWMREGDHVDVDVFIDDHTTLWFWTPEIDTFAHVYLSRKQCEDLRDNLTKALNRGRPMLSVVEEAELAATNADRRIDPSEFSPEMVKAHNIV